MARRPRDAEATRKKIMDEAQKLFIEQGFGSTSMAQISRACACANSLIVHHFRSKEGLWNEVKDRAFEDFVERSKAMFSGQPVSVADLRETTESYFRLLQDNPDLVQLLLRAELERDLDWNQINREQLAPFVARMGEAQAAGILRDDVPAAHLLLIVINAITRWFEARHMFRAWLSPQDGNLDRDLDGNLDEAFLDNTLKVIFEGALSPAARGVTP